MESTMNIMRALSDETRLRITLLLHQEPLCVCEISDILELSQPKVSKHLAKLKDLNLVQPQRQEQFMIYYTNKDNTLFIQLLETLYTHSLTLDTAQKDYDRLKHKHTLKCVQNRQTRLGALAR